MASTPRLSSGEKRRRVVIVCDCLCVIRPPETGKSTERGDLAICNTPRFGLHSGAFSVRPPHDTRPDYALRVSRIETLRGDPGERCRQGER